MTTVLIILAILLSLIGIFGSVVPGLPGHPLNYIALWCLQWAFHPFASTTLIVFGILTVVVLFLDYFVPIWTAKKYGATRQGIIGSLIGMMIGFFFTPVGMILGTIAGAIIGDMIAGKTHTEATRSGIATFVGTLVSIGMKLLLSSIMTSMVIYKLLIFLAN
jgi:uncharacterized protein YqgC (DUF456 family)